ncbi:hypothetical protein NCCP2140_05650 [Pseudoalteromonas sp. NCCP-2140]|uniref:hypothetical protein n=1 Tax=Pseudoalteromonas sp. NCCP-2140 TaxID=2942288 RepID=UPI00203C0FA7|nr:hypothetical protein [Pseudoalteromonas sp. NCCP-2140]GKW51512.1 hypothetical protein NCCP2140_05650 [Pseudoalteromonas sp. NCCP-2140]
MEQRYSFFDNKLKEVFMNNKKFAFVVLSSLVSHKSINDFPSKTTLNYDYIVEELENLSLDYLLEHVWLHANDILGWLQTEGYIKIHDIFYDYTKEADFRVLFSPTMKLLDTNKDLSRNSTSVGITCIMGGKLKLVTEDAIFDQLVLTLSQPAISLLEIDGFNHPI